MGKCSVCHNGTISKIITYSQWFKEKLVAVENVPAEICPVCGEEYFSPSVADKIQEAIESYRTCKTLEVPVYHFA